MVPKSDSTMQPPRAIEGSGTTVTFEPLQRSPSRATTV